VNAGDRVFHPRLGFGTLHTKTKFGWLVDFSDSSGVLIRECKASDLEITDEQERKKRIGK